jgi:uncharacterized damage-inducible protein DinB
VDDLRYPIGRFVAPKPVTFEHVRVAIDDIEACPRALRAVVRDLDDAQLDTPYRDGGWTVRQVVHHLPDSHMNAYVRMKLGVTETRPTVKPYEEARWAELEDGRRAPIELSLTLMDSLHARWTRWLRSLGEADFRRVYFHPDNGEQSLAEVTVHYAWHGKHHVAHITSLRRRLGW